MIQIPAELPPHHPERFRVVYRRARHYVDPLPACDLATATDARWPSVTTIKNRAWPGTFRKGVEIAGERHVVDLDALRLWRYLEANGGTVDTNDPAAMLRFLGAARDDLERAAARGNAVHAIADAVLTGQRWSATPDAEPYVDGLLAAIAELGAPAVAHIERVVINRTQGWGGTFDALLLLEGEWTLVDWKSRTEGSSLDPYETEVAQVGGYTLGEYLVDESDGAAVRVPMPPVSRLVVAAIGVDGAYQLNELDIDAAQEAWMAMLATADHRSKGEAAARRARRKPTTKEEEWKPHTPSPSGNLPIASLSGSDAGEKTRAPSSQTSNDSSRGVMRPTTASAPPPTLSASSPAPSDPRDRLAGLDEAQRTLLAARWPFTVPASQLGPDDFPALVRLLDDVARDAGAGFTPTEVPAVEPVAPIAYPAHTPWTPPDDGGPCDPEAAARLRANARQLPADVQGTIKAWVSEADAAGRWHPGDTVRWFEVARAMSDAALFYCTEACDEDLLREWLWAATGDEACAQPGIRLGVIFGSLTIDQARTVATAMGDAYGGASPDYSTGVPRLAA